MPKATETLGNCYRVSREGFVHGYFESEIKAKNYADWYFKYYGITRDTPFLVEKWFIVGEF